MYKIGLFEKIFSFLAHKTFLGFLVAATLIVSTKPLSLENKTQITGSLFDVEFSNFSPAFAAFEDGFLFNDENEVLTLAPGKESVDKTIQKTQTKTKVVKETVSKKKEKAARTLAFDGSIEVTEIEFMAQTKKITKPQHKKIVKQVTPPKTVQQAIRQQEELGSGPLVAMVRKNINPRKQGLGFPVRAIATKKPQASPVKSESNNNEEVTEQALGREKPKPQPLPEVIRVAGGITLKEGLAFIGTMEVSWVVDDYELQIGSINTPDATFEINVKNLIGDVVISLYDNNDELIGEGLADLTQAQVVDGEIQTNIQVKPIDWDYAGQVVDVESVGVLAPKTISGVNIELYAFNEATQSDTQGEFRLFNWKKTNSRSIAIASKEGFFDSIFMIDSKKEARVMLIDDNYMQAFFSFIEELGIYNVKDLGTIYGSIQGPEAEGYSVHLQSAKPLYFMSSGFASTKMEQTSSNGLFAFVGLQDGDYELTIEKGGEVLDHKVVIVEQGKVSPVIVDLTSVKKHFQFYNPMNPEEKIERVDLSFFDGVESVRLDEDNALSKEVTRGNDPSLLDYAGSDAVTRTFVSRNKGLQRLPLLQDGKLSLLAKQKGLSIKEGLMIGFVDSPQEYRVGFMEGDPEQVLYFNRQGQEVDPKKEVAFGFIMGGFPKGLSSVVVDRVSDGMILMTDMIYSDHQAISIVNSQIISVE